MRIIFSFILLLMSCMMSAQSKYEVVSSSNLNVRSAPDTRASVIGSLKPGEQVIVVSVEGRWAEVIFNGKKGFASASFLRMAEYSSERPISQSSGPIGQYVYEVISSSRLNIRSKPSTQSEIIGTLAPGQRIENGTEVGQWLRFEYESKHGYVSLRYLKKTERTSSGLQNNKPVAGSSQTQETGSQVERQSVGRTSVPEKRQINSSLLQENYLVHVPCISSDRIDIYLSGRFGLGLSSFTWKEGAVDGGLGLALDVAAQAYWNDQVSFIPRGYYAEASLGYAFKGAAGLPMHYIDFTLSPFGYYHDFSDFRLTGCVGPYFGIPVSSLKYVGLSKFDVGLNMSASIEYNLLSLGLEFDHGFTNISVPSVKLNNWSLMAKLTCKIISFNK